MSGAALLLATLLSAQSPGPGPGPKQAGPEITVRGATRLEMESIQRVQGGVMLTVKLVDADLGEGVPNKTVKLSISQNGGVVFRTTATTSTTGSAQVFVPHRTGDYVLKLDFDGDPLYVAAKPKAQSVDLSKDAISLTLDCPPLVDVAGRPFPVAVTAKHEDGVANLHVTLQIQRGDKVIKTLRGLTGADGQWKTKLEPRGLGSAGELLLVASTPVTSRFNAARTTGRVSVFSRVKVTLSLSKKRARIGSKITLKGTVRDAFGPVRRGILRLATGSRRLGVVLTDAEGRYSLAVKLDKIGLGKIHMRAHFVPRTGWRKAGVSPPVVLVVEPAKPIPLAYFLVPAGITVLFLLTVLVIRKRPWEGLRKRLAKRSAAKLPQGGGIELGKRRSFSSIFAVDHLSVSGSVTDLHRSEPLAGARIYLRPGDAEQGVKATTTDPAGRFELADLTPGTYTLVATSPGWIPQSLTVELPHRGELHGLTIRLQSVRVRVMQIYADVVRHLLPEPELVRYWTPGETTRHVLGRYTTPPAGLSSLTALTQYVYYSQEPPEVDTVLQAESLAQEATAPEGES